MRCNSLPRQILLGIVLAAVLMPTTAQAQWTVFDPTAYALQIRKRIEEIKRWVETVNQYSRMYENAVGQLTNLKGILQTVDESLANERRMRNGRQARCDLKASIKLNRRGQSRAVMRAT